MSANLNTTIGIRYKIYMICSSIIYIYIYIAIEWQKLDKFLFKAIILEVLMRFSIVIDLSDINNSYDE